MSDRHSSPRSVQGGVGGNSGLPGPGGAGAGLGPGGAAAGGSVGGVGSASNVASSILAQISGMSLNSGGNLLGAGGGLGQGPGISAMAPGDVDHSAHLSNEIGHLFDNEQFSDVTLNIDGVKIPAHRVILAARSAYFRALLYGGMKESSDEEVQIQESPAVFRILLRYVYTGQINLSSMREETLLDVLGMAHVYGFIHLEESISEYLMANLNIRNVCQIFVAAILFELQSLIDVCCAFIDRCANEVLKHESFTNLSLDALKFIISRDSFCAKEVDIFNAVQSWVAANPTLDSSEILGLIRLPLMALSDLLNIVRPSGLIGANVILDAIKVREESRDSDLSYRGCLIHDENVATARHGAQVLQGEMRSALLDGDTTTYDMERGFTRHHIDDNDGQGILVRLGSQYILNHINLLLWDKDGRSYSYYIEVSIDDKDWVRVIDHTWVLCRSWQYLYFPKRVVKYIRIVGTHNTVNRVFHVVSLEAMFSTKQFTTENGLLVPDYNVATIGNSATVIEGVSRARNALINGDWQRYDWDTGYTCHQIANGEIVIQLNQPYMVDSLRLLLWDMDIRTYSYYIEVSLDQQHWNLIADKRGEACRSWQTIRFDRRAVVFIRIVGTYNTANEVFHCVHFEMPASKSALEGIKTKGKGDGGGGGGGSTDGPDDEDPKEGPSGQGGGGGGGSGGEGAGPSSRKGNSLDPNNGTMSANSGTLSIQESLEAHPNNPGQMPQPLHSDEEEEEAGGQDDEQDSSGIGGVVGALLGRMGDQLIAPDHEEEEELDEHDPDGLIADLKRI